MARWGSVDFEQLKVLQRKMQALDDLNQKFCEAAAKELAARLLAKVIRLTPVGVKPEFDGPLTMKVRGEDRIVQTTNKKGEKVFSKRKGKQYTMLTAEGARKQQYWQGYTGGTLRRGWTGGVNQDATKYAQNLPIVQAGDTFEVEIINPVEYAPYVEYGHRQSPGRYVPAIGKSLKRSWVPGKFMLTKSEIELNAQAPAILEKKLQKYLEEAFKR